MRILRILSLFFCLFSCNNKMSSTENQIVIENDAIPIIVKSDLTNLDFVDFILDDKAERLIESWEKYFELHTYALNVKQADLSFFKNNNKILNIFIQEMKSTLPENINSKPIQARITALETKMYKLESALNLSNVHKEDLILAIKEFLVSFSNLNFQINKKFEREAQNIQKPK